MFKTTCFHSLLNGLVLPRNLVCESNVLLVLMECIMDGLLLLSYHAWVVELILTPGIGTVLGDVLAWGETGGRQGQLS